MATLKINSNVVLEILNREIPKLFSDEGNKQFITDDVEISWLDENGDDAWVSDWHIEIRERERLPKHD